MATGPQAFFDVTKLLKEFDPNKMVAEFSNALKQYKLTGVDLDSLVSSQKKNLEALTSANRVAYEGLQAVAKRQAEILQETMNEASKAVDQLSKTGSPPEIAAKQAELTKSAFERALPHMPREELVWRMHFMFGTLAYTLAATDTVQLIAGCKPEDRYDARLLEDRLTAFLAAGLHAPLKTSIRKAA